MVGEVSNVTVSVTLSADPERTVVIPTTATGQGGASSTDDYSVVPASLTFDNGDAEQSLTFTATADDVDDDGESVLLGFGSLPTGIAAGTTSQAIVSITSDEVPAVTVSFEQSSYTVAESDDPDTPGVEESRVTVKVSVSADPERSVEIPVLKLGLDGAGSEDYSGVPESLTFDSGVTEMSFTFTALRPGNDYGMTVPPGAREPLRASVEVLHRHLSFASVHAALDAVEQSASARHADLLLRDCQEEHDLERGPCG